MKSRFVAALALSLVLAAFAGSCAVSDPAAGVTGATDVAPTQDPARIGLPPLYRPFFDALRDDGDWTLIEPYGWCFRPRENYASWRPYVDGWWEPSDTYGWIWNTNEDHGWITYHYGAWFWDSYQGWCWQPGPSWGPAWVAWVSVGDWIGWAPLGPSSYDGFDAVPGGMFTFAPARDLAARDAGMNSVYLDRLPDTRSPAREIVNVGRVGGVTFNRGPDFLDLQRMGAPVPERVDGSGLPRVRLGSAPARPSEADFESRTNRLLTAGLREWRDFAQRGVAPPPAEAGPRVRAPSHPRPMPAPEPVRAERDSVRAPRHHAAPADTARATPPPRPEPRERGRGAERDSTRGRG